MTQTFTSVFGGDTVPPSQYAYRAIALAANTQFYWPEMATGPDILPSLSDVTASGLFNLRLPDASQVSTGRDVVIYNAGINTFNITDFGGNQLFNLTTGIGVYIYLTDNSTQNGVWRTFTYGAGVAASAAAAIAGEGLEADGGLVRVSDLVDILSASYSILPADRAHIKAFTGGSSTATLPALGTISNGYFVGIKNDGVGTITITTPDATPVDLASTVLLAPGEGLFCYTDGATEWTTIGHGRSTVFDFTIFVKDLTGIAAYTLTTAEAANKLLQFTGTPSANTTIILPAVVSVYYIQIATTNAYTITLKTPAGTGVTIATGEKVILVCDAVNISLSQTIAGIANLNFVTGTLAVTNGGTGRVNQASLLPTAHAAGGVDTITATFVPPISLVDGQKCTIFALGANTSTTPTFAPDGLTSHTITMNSGQPLVAGSIKGADYCAILQYDLANTRWELLNPYLGDLPVLLAAKANLVGPNTFTGAQDFTGATLTAATPTTSSEVATFDFVLATLTPTGPVLPFVPGDTYIFGDLVFSLIDLLTYRHSTPTSSLMTDPSLDPTNWVNLYPQTQYGKVYFMANH